MDVRKRARTRRRGPCRAAICRNSSLGVNSTVNRGLDRQPAHWGVDAGAASRIRQALVDLAKSGSAVLVISQDLDEIFEVATEIAVISEGKLSDIYPASDLSREKIGLLMGGMYGKTETAETAHAH